MDRLLKVGMVLFGAVVSLPSMASAQSGTTTTTENATAEDPNDKSPHERSFEETRKHMQLHSEWSKQSGKMNDN